MSLATSFHHFAFCLARSCQIGTWLPIWHSPLRLLARRPLKNPDFSNDSLLLAGTATSLNRSFHTLQMTAGFTCCVNERRQCHLLALYPAGPVHLLESLSRCPSCQSIPGDEIPPFLTTLEPEEVFQYVDEMIMPNSSAATDVRHSHS